MTFTRFIIAICICTLLLPQLAGQQQDPSNEVVQLTESQLLTMEAMAVDSAGDKLDVPNVFTPNGDQINDYFEVSTDGTTVYEFSIFTRGGSRIYYSQSPQIFWDGNSLDGKALKEGVYYYVIEEEGGSDPFQHVGFMHLFR